ncbi:hypothetical protein FQZ97_1086180 [compost metagenome]
MMRYRRSPLALQNMAFMELIRSLTGGLASGAETMKPACLSRVMSVSLARTDFRESPEASG